MKWFYKDWWQYLLAPKCRDVTWLDVILCRMRGHPAGVYWFNVGYNEPNMHCKNCQDDLG